MLQIITFYPLNYAILINLEEKTFLQTSFYFDDLPEEYALDIELQAWYLKWKHYIS